MSLFRGWPLSPAIKTYPVPSLVWPAAFISRRTLPPEQDQVFGRNARYPRQATAIARSFWRSRQAVACDLTGPELSDSGEDALSELRPGTVSLLATGSEMPRSLARFFDLRRGRLVLFTRSEAGLHRRSGCAFQLHGAGLVIAEGPARIGAPREALASDLEFAALQCALRLDLLERCLRGKDPFTPNRTYQEFWAQALEPLDSPEDEDLVSRIQRGPLLKDDEGSWGVLQRLCMPWVREYASPAHLRGIERFGLDRTSPPEFAELAAKLASFTGWELVPSEGELGMDEFFSLLATRRFPFLARMRPRSAVLCGFEPDLWHEAIGHLSLLADSESAAFYEFCGQLYWRLSPANRPDLARLLFVLLEYGFVGSAPDPGSRHAVGSARAFGAALASSYVALQRIRRGYVATRPFVPQSVLDSGIADEGAVRRDRQGRILFFQVESLAQARKTLESWAARLT